MLYELHPVVRFLMTQLEASVDKNVALVSKHSRMPAGVAHFVIHGLVSNSAGQSLLADFFVVSMYMNGGLQGKPMPFEDFVKVHQLDKELYTEAIEDADILNLQKLLPTVIDFAKQLHMDQQQQTLQWDMEKKLAVYEEKLKNWKASKDQQMQLEFGNKPEYGFVKSRRENKEYEIQTILNNSSQYFKDLTSLNGDAYLKVLAVFYN